MIYVPVCFKKHRNQDAFHGIIKLTLHITYCCKNCERLWIKHVYVFAFSAENQTANGVVFWHGLLQRIQTRYYCLQTRYTNNTRL